jgi:uncharacterized protein YqhQ
VAWRKRQRSRIHDVPPKALIGGQAVQEGVIMRSASAWAVAVRTPKGDIEIQTEPIEPLAQRHWFWHEPIIRGFAAVRQSSEAGSKAIESIAGAQSKEDEESAEPTIPGRPLGRLSSIYSAIKSPFRSLITLYFLVPLGLTSLIMLIMGQLGSLVLFLLVESLVRAAIWIGFTVARDKEMRRLYEYHGAEHKSISCYEAEDELVPARAKLYPRLHPRCGTGLAAIVILISPFVFAPIGLPEWQWLVLSRILGAPLILGLSLEVQRVASLNLRKRWVRMLMWPSLMFQYFTTREPDEKQLAVAIAALKTVLDRDTPPNATDRQQAEILT